jgi:hypothetical protein
VQGTNSGDPGKEAEVGSLVSRARLAIAFFCPHPLNILKRPVVLRASQWGEGCWSHGVHGMGLPDGDGVVEQIGLQSTSLLLSKSAF